MPAGQVADSIALRRALARYAPVRAWLGALVLIGAAAHADSGACLLTGRDAGLEPPAAAVNRRIVRVGPGFALKRPSQAAALAQDDDRVEIAAGDYHGDVAVWRAHRLQLVGVGDRVRLHADGAHAEGKAIWVIRGDDATIENIEFHGAKVRDRNGAGIRQEGANLTLRRAGFFDNQTGLLAASHPRSTIRIEQSEFARNGAGDGQSHNLYVNRVDQVVVYASYFHEAKVGHQFKSRARCNVIENSYFGDLTGGTASFAMDFPNGGDVVLRGNVLQQGERAAERVLIAIGAEGAHWPQSRLQMTHNSLLGARAGRLARTAPLIWIKAPLQHRQISSNLFVAPAGIDIIGDSAPQAHGNVRWALERIPAGAAAQLDLRPSRGDLAELDLSEVTDALFVERLAVEQHPPRLPLALAPAPPKPIAGALQTAR